MEFPEVGEIIIASVTKIMDHGAYVTLDEYDDIQGFLHISEIAPGWIRSVSKYVKIGEKKVLLVKRVSKNRSDIDLSLKQISADQRKKKLLEVKKEPISSYGYKGKYLAFFHVKNQIVIVSSYSSNVTYAP